MSEIQELIEAIKKLTEAVERQQRIVQVPVPYPMPQPYPVYPSPYPPYYPPHYVPPYNPYPGPYWTATCGGYGTSGGSAVANCEPTVLLGCADYSGENLNN